jgi:23S rRNA methylase
LINEHNDEYRLYAKAGKVSRSQFKLIEALRKFKITMHGGRALDLGAAPGGWSNVLLGLGMEVTAVDPAALDPVVAASPNLVHLASISEIPPDGKFDLIVDDMNIDAESSAMMLVGLSRLLGNGSNAIITLKLKKGSNPFKAVNSAIHILWQSYDVVSVASLFHNRLEVTLLLAKKG